MRISARNSRFDFGTRIWHEFRQTILYCETQINMTPNVEQSIEHGYRNSINTMDHNVLC